MNIGVRMKYPLFLKDYTELEISLQIFEIYSNIIVVPVGQTDRHNAANS
jgi:hypothetical protein